MRVLVTTNAAVGHFAPLVPTVKALVDAGHEVRVGCPESFAPTVTDAGLPVLACWWASFDSEVPPPPASDAHTQRLAWAVTRSWPDEARGWVHSLLEQSRAWRPELVVVEPVEHAGRIVAAALRVPLVEQGWGFTLPEGMSDSGAAGLLDLYAGLGVDPRQPGLRVDLGVARVQAADAPALPRYQYQPWSQPGQALPEPDGRPRVLVTLGTYDNPDAAQRIRAVVTAALEVGAQVIAALGNPDRRSGLDFPPEVAVVDWVDLPKAVETCSAVVHHGGAGTTWATLAAGRPSICTPQMGDQFRNAALVRRAGAGATVQPHELQGPALAAAIGTVLSDPEVARQARRLMQENLALPDAAQLAADITSGWD